VATHGRVDWTQYQNNAQPAKVIAGMLRNGQKKRREKMKTGKWIELWDKENNRLLRIVYNPYLKPIKEVIAFWIPKEYQSLVKGKISR